MMGANTISAPIKINLTGEYVIPIDGQKPVAGSVSGDLRLPSLDAFLSTLNKPMIGTSEASQSLANGFRMMLEQVDRKTLKDHDIVLEITCSTNPATHEMKHTFRFGTQSKAKR